MPTPGGTRGARIPEQAIVRWRGRRSIAEEALILEGRETVGGTSFVRLTTAEGGAGYFALLVLFIEAALSNESKGHEARAEKYSNESQGNEQVMHGCSSGILRHYFVYRHFPIFHSD
jgi:hypothetical protein